MILIMIRFQVKRIWLLGFIAIDPGLREFETTCTKFLVDSSLSCFPFPVVAAEATLFLFLPPRVLSIGGETLMSGNADDDEDNHP